MTSETRSVLQNFDNTFADDFDIAAGKLLQYREHQLLLAHDRGILDFMLFSKSQQFRWRLALQLLQLISRIGSVLG